MHELNVVGPQVRKIRNERGWNQEELAAQLNIAGWDISRSSLAKIEAQVRSVTDKELLQLCSVLKVDLESLFPRSSLPKPKRR